MYETFFNLTERPFDLTPNTKYLFLTASHREALSNLEYGIVTRTGVTVLVGEAGTGKTTLIRATLESTKAGKTFAVYLNNPTLTRNEFFEFINREFKLGSTEALSKTALLGALEGALREMHKEGTVPALIIDEAQSLPHELLEEVRLLANIETSNDKLLPIVLVGQPELTERLNHVALRQLKQRIGLRCQLQALTLPDTAAYISARMRVAGGDAGQIFTRDAVALIYERSHGIPRTISVICHNALINAFALGRNRIDRAIIRDVCADFDLGELPAALPRYGAAALLAETGSNGNGHGNGHAKGHGDGNGHVNGSVRSDPDRDQRHPEEPVTRSDLFARFAAPRRFSFFFRS